jgi:hypothetical protein
MAKNPKRSVSRKMKRTRRNKRDKRTHKRTRGGMDQLVGAPLKYHLAGSWPSRMSLGQGADYFQYHEGQHGGAALSYGAFPGAVLDGGLPPALRGPAHIGGIDQAIKDVLPLCDPPNCPKVGGKRNKKNKTKGGKRTKKNKRNVSKRNKRNKRKGGSLGFAPFPSSGMLLDSQKAYAQAGLNPGWKTDIAFTDAKIRDTQ